MASKPGGLLLPGIGLTLKRRLSPTGFNAKTRRLVEELRTRCARAEAYSSLTALTRQNLVLMIFEDAHWSDPTSLEALGRIVDLIGTLRNRDLPAGIQSALDRAAARDGADRQSAGREQHWGHYRLHRRKQAAAVEDTAGHHRANRWHPFVRGGDDQGGAGGRERGSGRADSRGDSIPASLHPSLMARLDRLGPAKEFAQIGAAIGREFSHPLLAGVTRRPESELQGALDRLIAAGLLYRQGVPPHATYRFKHALVQDAAYGTLLREPRRALHARITEILEGDFAGCVS